VIPKIIHQYWDGDIPESYKKYMDSIRSTNLDFQYFLWDKKSIIESFYDHPLIPYIKNSNQPMVCSDISRIILLDIKGGIYLDSDMVAVNPISEDILIHNAFASYESEFHFGQMVANGAVGSIPDSVFVWKLVSEVLEYDMEKIKTLKNSDSWLYFGPCLWTKIFFDLKCKHIAIYPSWYFIPNHYCDENETETIGYFTNHIWQSGYKKPPEEWCKAYALSALNKNFPSIQDLK